MDFYQEWIEKPIPRYDKCLIHNGDYVEKQKYGSIIKSELFLVELQRGTPKYMHCERVSWPILKPYSDGRRGNTAFKMHILIVNGHLTDHNVCLLQIHIYCCQTNKQ